MKLKKLIREMIKLKKTLHKKRCKNDGYKRYGEPCDALDEVIKELAVLAVTGEKSHGE